MRKVLLGIVAILLIASIGLACGPVEPEPEPEPGPLCTIIRDDYGIPHVFADTKEGLGFGAGYAMAQDRLWQADVMRRAASGRLAEFDLATIEEDAATRTLWYGQEELLEMYDDWDPGEGYEHLKPMIEAYIDGINTYIEEGLADPSYSLLPIEYVGLGLTSYLEPFTVGDVVGITVLMGWRFGGTGGNEGDFYEALLTLQTMHGATNGTAIWDDVFPLNDSGAPVTIPGEGPLGDFSTGMTLLDFPDNLGEILQQYEEYRAVQDELFESLGIPTKFGSNAVPISPELSATGNTLQLGGPQMGYSIPQVVLEIGLHGAGINAVGMAFPAAGPFILIGVGEYGAWTSTTGASDVMDTRILTLNPENPLQYWHDGAWVDMEVRTETIYGFKKQTSQNETCYRSLYGPIVAVDLDTDTAITIHTPFFKNEIAGEQGWQLFQEATNIDEFETAVELMWPNHNFYWADTEGNIGFWHAGRFPVKPGGTDRRLPLAGDGTEEWVRVTDPEEMPRVINPDQGWLANWNNKPIADWQYAESDVHWGEGHRVQRLMDVLDYYETVVGEVTVADMNTINQIGGYNHINGMNFVDYLIAAAEGTGNATVDTARDELIDWATFSPLPHSYVDLVSPVWPEPDPTYDHPGLTIFDAWYNQIIPEVFDGILPSSVTELLENYPSLLIRVFEDAALNYDYLGERDRDELIVNALKDAIDALAIQYGSGNMTIWLTPVRMQSYDEMGFLPGDELHPFMNRGTYNQIAELCTTGLPQAVSVIPPGQSGFVYYPGVASPHVGDQVLLYATWTYKPMLFTRAEVEAVKTWEREFE
jgi:penicillin amidase